MVVGVDVHKGSHAVALLDERGAVLATLSVAKQPCRRGTYSSYLPSQTSSVWS
jgi:hypothetical protein